MENSTFKVPAFQGGDLCDIYIENKPIILCHSCPFTNLLPVFLGGDLWGIYMEKQIHTPLLRSPLTFVVTVFQGSDLCNLEKQLVIPRHIAFFLFIF